MSTEPASQYSHISYTPSDTESRIDALIEASHHWTPVQGRIIKNFDTRAFTEALLAEVPATSSRPTKTGLTQYCEYLRINSSSKEHRSTYRLAQGM